jgi:anthranilate phosphoribosyltransferase
MAVSGQHLGEEQAHEAMLAILTGEATTAQIAAFLVALKMKGERPAELVGFARAMRDKATKIEVDLAGEPLIDTCGTGGDGGGTFNVSTAAALVVAGAGVRVAKHGNRSLSSLCGSADVLEQLGVNIAMSAETAAHAIRETGIGFLFAPAIHPAMKHAQPARAELKMRTAFNLLGPLTNPAGAQYQLVGAPSLDAARLMAEALSVLGVERAWVVHGSDGLDEITLTGPTTVFDVRPGQIDTLSVQPRDFGMEPSAIEALRGGDRCKNAEIIRAILNGEKGPRRDIVVANAAAALLVAGKAETIEETVVYARQAIDSGEASRRLVMLTVISQ